MHRTSLLVRRLRDRRPRWRSSAAASGRARAAAAAALPRQGRAGPPPRRRRRPSRSPSSTPTPIEDASEFIATLRSLRSTTVQPEVEGIITRIFVKAGDRVKAGTPLVQIKPAKQQAAVSSAEANRAGTEADVAYWRQQVKRLESLVEAGAVSKAGVRSGAELAAHRRGAARRARRAGARRTRRSSRSTASSRRRRARSATFPSASAIASRPRR